MNFYSVLRESVADVERAIRAIDKKDWERASKNYTDNQIVSMFKKITDPRKKIGRAAAFFIYKHYIESAPWTREYIDKIDGVQYKDFIDYFGGNDVLGAYEKLKTLSLPDEIESKLDAKYARAVDREEARKEKARQAEEKAEAERLAKKEEEEFLKAQYLSGGGPVFSIKSKWNSFGGRLGNYSPTALTPAGRNMSGSAIIKRLEKYEASGNYFCVVGYHGGVDYETGSYSGRKTFTKDLVKAFREWFSYDSDAYLSVYKIKKRVK